MARQQLIQLSAINVVLNPHPEGIYSRLIRQAFRLRTVAKVHGDRYGMFSQISRIEENGELAGFQGVISTFTRLQSDLPWFNTATTEDASERDLEEVGLPEHLQPNHRKCNYFFDVRRHIFIFESLSRKGGIPAKAMLGFLESVFGDARLEASFPGLRMTIIKDSREVDEIIEWDAMRTLTICVNRPNPDYDEDDLEDLGQWLGEQNADHMEQKLVAERGEHLQPNEKVQTIAAIAAENGYVEATGIDEFGQSVVKSTKSRKPLVEKGTYDSDGETFWDAFNRLSRSVRQRIAHRRRNMRAGNRQR